MSNVQRLDQLARAAGTDGALDLRKLGEVEQLLGEAATSRMLDRLAADVASRLSDGAMIDGERSDVACAVHAMASATGLLGFMALSGACSSLERACRQDEALGAATAELRAERDKALALLGALCAAAAAA